MLLSNLTAPFKHTDILWTHHIVFKVYVFIWLRSVRHTHTHTYRWTHISIYQHKRFPRERVKNRGNALGNMPTTNSSIWASCTERFAWPVRFHTLPVPKRNVQEICRILEDTPKDAWWAVQSTNIQTKRNLPAFVCIHHNMFSGKDLARHPLLFFTQQMKMTLQTHNHVFVVCESTVNVKKCDNNVAAV